MNPRLIIIHIDGFSFEYINRDSTPFLASLCQDGLGQRMAPSVFFQSNLSAYTGKEAVSHGRIVEYIYDPGNSPFSGFKKFSLILDSLDSFMPYHVQKVWRHCVSWLYTTLFNKPAIKLHFIPFSLCQYFNFSFNPLRMNEQQIVSASGREPRIVREGSTNINGEDIFISAKKAGLRTAWDDEERAYTLKRLWMGTYFYRLYPDVMTDWAIERIKQGIELIWVDLGAELDKWGHRYGPDSSRFPDALKKIDRDLEKLITMAQGHGYHFIIFSDHGMERVKGAVNISARLKTQGLINGRDYICFYDSTLARFWAEDKNVIQRIKTLLAEAGQGRCIDEKDSIDIGIPLDKSIGQLVFAVRQEYIILPNFYQGKKMVRGMHGYLENNSGPLDGIFITDLSREKSQSRSELKDIANLALKTIGIK